jgi:hypothetical protein
MELNLPGERSYKNVTDKDIKNASPEEIAQAIDMLLSRKDFDLIKRIQALRPDVMNEESKKDSLNEHYVAGGIVGIGAINQIPSRVKADYEDAFEHFLGQKYALNEEEDVEEGKEVEEPSLYEAESPTKEEIAAFEAAVEQLMNMAGMSREDATMAIGRAANAKTK